MSSMELLRSNDVVKDPTGERESTLGGQSYLEKEGRTSKLQRERDEHNIILGGSNIER